MHYPQIDILKGFAITLVVIGHFYPATYQNEFWTYLNHLIYSFHMALFMSISGFLYASSNLKVTSLETYKNFVKKKFLRLMIPYFSISLIIIFTKLIVSQFFILKYPVNLDTIFYHLFIMPMGGAVTFLWFIYVLMLIFLLYPLLAIKIKNTYILLILSFLLTFLELPTFFSLNLLADFLFYFVLGINLFKIQEHIFYKYKFKYVLIPISVSITLFLTIQEGSIKTLLGICLMWWVSILLSQKYEMYIIKYIGMYSPTIYLFHTFSMGGVYILFSKYINLTQISFYLIALVSIVAGLIIPIYINKVMNKSPKLNLIFLGNK